MKRIAILFALLALTGVVATGCSQDADVVSENLSTDADNFKVNRRIVFFNGITDKYLLEIDGFCSLGNDDPKWRLSVTCDLGGGQYKKHFLGLSDNVSYFVEQVDSKNVSKNQYKVTFKPSEIIPDIEMNSGAN